MPKKGSSQGNGKIPSRLRSAIDKSRVLPRTGIKALSKAPADLAVDFAKMDEQKKHAFLRRISIKKLAKSLEHFYQPEIDFVLENLPEKRLRATLALLPDDELADIIQSRQDNKEICKKLMSLLDGEKRKLAGRLLKYDEDTAGGRMTTDIVCVNENISVADAIAEISHLKESTALLQRIFVIDERRRILGKVRLRDLTFSDRSLPISEIMHAENIAIRADADQEEAANLIAKHDMLYLPVVSNENKLLGVITFDDSMEILQEETTEDIEKIHAISGRQEDISYLSESAWAHAKRRLVWALVMAFVGIAAGKVIHHFENALDACFLLAVYMPMIVAAGGNTGGQAAAMAIRALSLDEVNVSDFVTVAWKELRVGFIIGASIGAAIFLQILFLPVGQSSFDPKLLGFTVALGLLLQISVSTLVGGLLPIIAKAVKLDPAAFASPILTTLADVLGLTLYFNLASHVLKLNAA